MAFTKKQKEFFDRFARNMLTNTLVLRLQQSGEELDQETIDKITVVVDSSDVSELSNAIGTKLLELVDFALLLKAEKFFNMPDTKKALEAAQAVGIAVQTELHRTLEELFTPTAAE